jgi:hypothetical protein
MNPPYEIWYNQFKGTFTSIDFENGDYSTTLLMKCRQLKMMNFINNTKSEMIPEP